MNQKKVFISIINWNRWDITIECVESLLKLDYPNYHIIMIDNNSTNDSLENIQAYLRRQLEPHYPKGSSIEKYVAPIGTSPVSHNIILENDFTLEYLEGENLPTVTIVKNPENYGFGYAHNQTLNLIENSKLDAYVWVLNNDVVVAPDSLTELVKSLEGDTKTAYVGSLLPFYHEPELLQCAGGATFIPLLGFGKLYKKNAQIDSVKDLTDEEIARNINYIPGTSILFRKEALKELHGFHPDFKIYTEDVDLAFRAKKAGWNIRVAKESIVYHMESKSTAGRKGMFYFLYHRGNVVFLRKHFPVFIFISAIPGMIIHSLKMSFSLVNTWFTIKGIAAGFREKLTNGLQVNN